MDEKAKTINKPDKEEKFSDLAFFCMASDMPPFMTFKKIGVNL